MVTDYIIMMDPFFSVQMVDLFWIASKKDESYEVRGQNKKIHIIDIEVLRIKITLVIKRYQLDRLKFI